MKIEKKPLTEYLNFLKDIKKIPNSYVRIEYFGYSIPYGYRLKGFVSVYDIDLVDAIESVEKYEPEKIHIEQDQSSAEVHFTIVISIGD